MADSIKVAVRLRKLIQREEDQKLECHWMVKDSCVCEKTDGKSDGHKYAFDKVYDQEAMTDVIYDDLIAPILEDAMSGMNGTVFAYGQTASGKTYTMLGTSDSPGIIPMCISDIYNTVENTPDREFLIRISYMEIYNENVVDLLGDVKKFLNVYDTVEGKVQVRDVTEEVVTSAKQIKVHLKKGEAARHYGSTNMNEKSSRSHTIFRVIIESRERVTNHRDSFDGAVMVAHLNLVDLAGSEKAKQTGATGQRLTEGGFINKSLFTLSQVITQVGNNAAFVSYRDSKLTRILQNSVGGNSKTAIICAVTPVSLEETHSTLRFATSAKRITNRPVVNEVISDEALMRKMQQEIACLKKQLEKKGQDNMQTANQELQQKLAEKERLQHEQDEKIQRLMELISVSSRLKPTSEEDFRLKKKRRETWCPGKDRHSLAPKDFSKFSAGRTRELCSMVEEDCESIAEEDDGHPDLFFCPTMMTDDDFRSVTCSVYAQTDPMDDHSSKVLDKGDSFESLQQKVKDQDNTIGELQKSMSTMKQNYDDVVTAKDLEIAELKLAMLCVGTSEGSEGSSRSHESIVSSKSPSIACRNDDPQATNEIRRLEEELKNNDKEIQALREALRESTETVEKLINRRNSTDSELHQERCQIADKPVPVDGASEKSEVQDMVEAMEDDVSGTADCTLVSEEKLKVLQQELAAVKEQLAESMTFSASLVEEISLLQTKLASSNESKKVADETYETLRKEFEELSEFTRYEKELRDVSILEKQEETQRELIEQVVSLEAQLKVSKNREEMLKTAMQEQASDSSEQEMQFSGKNSGEGDLAAEKEMLLSHISDLERQIEVLKLLEVERDKLTEMNQELEAKLTSLVEQQKTLNTSEQTLEKVSQLEQEKLELVQQIANLESRFNKLPNHLSEVTVTCVASEQSTVETRSTVETQTECELEEMNLKNDLEQQLQESELMVTALKEEVRQLTLQLENMSSKDIETTDSDQNEALVEKIQSLEQQLHDSSLEHELLKNKLEEQASLAIDAQNDLLELQDEAFDLKSQLEKREKHILELEQQLNQMTQSEKEATLSKSSGDCVSSVKPVDVDVTVKRNTGSLELMDERQAFVELQRKHEKVTAELKAARDQVLLCSNKDLDVQKCRGNLEQVIKDMNAAVAQSNKENKALVDQLNKDVYELSCKLQKTGCDLQCAQHRLTEAEKEKVQLKAEIQTAEGLLFRQDSFRKGPGEMDPEKLMERIKKMSVQNDLTNQRCQNYEAKMKTMEAAAQKFEAVQIERNSLQFQLREAQEQFRQTREEMVRIQQARSNSYTETAQMGLHVANLENKLQSLTRQKEVLQMELETEKKEKLEAVENLEKLKLDERRRENELSEVKEQLVSLTSRKEAMQCEVEGREKERVATVTELERISSECQQKEDELLVVKEQLTVLTSQKDELQRQLEAQGQIRSSNTTEMERLCVQLQEKDEELCSVKEQLTTLTFEKDDLEFQLSTQEKEKLAASVDLERILSDHQQKEAELCAVKEQLTEFTSEKVALERERDSQKKDQSAMLSKVDRLTEERQQLESELTSIKEQLTMLQEMMKKESDRELRKKNSEPDKTMEHKIEEVRKEEKMRWTAVLEAKVKEMERDAEEKRCEEILKIQQQAMEKLQEISDNMDAEKQEKIKCLRKQHAKELGELEQKFSDELRQLEEKYREDAVNLKAENEKLKLVTNGHVEDVEELRHRFEQDLQEKESELSDMEVILTKKEIEIGELEQQLKELSEEIESSRQQCSQPRPNEEVSTALQKQLDSLKAEHRSQMATKAKEFESARADQAESLQRQHQEELARISGEHQSQLKECKLRHSAAVNEAVKKTEIEMEKRIRDLEELYSEDLRKTEVSITMLKEELQKLSRLEKELAEKTTHVSQLQEMLDSTEQKHKETCEAVARLEAERCSAVGEKEREISELMDANSKLQKSVGCLKEQVELLELELTSGEEEYKCSLAKVEMQVAEVQQLLAEKDNRVRLLEVEIEQLECRLSTLNAEIQEKVEALRKNMNELKLQSTETAKLKECRNEMRLQASSNQNLAFECENLRAEKCELSVQVQLVQEKESELKIKHLATVDEVTKMKQQFQEEINSLKLQLNETEQKRQELRSNVEKLEAENKKDKDEIEDLEKYSNEVVEELRKVKDFICDEQEKQRMEKHRTASESDAPRLRRERNELRVKVKCLESQVSGLNVECATSRQEYERIKQKMKDEIERLQQEKDVGVEKELEEKKIEVGRLKLKVNELETNFVAITDPLKAKLKGQALEIMRLEGDTKRLKDEVKKLRTALTERPMAAASAPVGPEVPVAGKSNTLERMSVGTVSGGGIISDFNYYLTKAENETMKRDNDNLQAQLTSLKSKVESLKKENTDLNQLSVEQDKKLAKYREQFAGTPGDVQRTPIGAVNSPEGTPKTCTDGQADSPAIDVQKWLHGDSNPYDTSLLVKTVDAENCKTQ